MLILAALMGVALDFSQQTLNVEGRVLWVQAADFNGDGSVDLLVCSRRHFDPYTKRFLAYFFRRDGAFPEKPNEERAVADNAAFAVVADLDKNGTSELVLQSASGVSAFFMRDGKLSAAAEELVRVETAAAFAEAEDLPLWDFVRDWHEVPGAATPTAAALELAVWRVGSLQLYRSDASGKYGLRETLQLPPTAWMDSARSGVFRGTHSNRTLSIAIGYVFPELVVGDYEGDGVADLFVIEEDRLRVFAGGTAGRFSERPTVELDFNVRTTEEKQRKNAFISAKVADLNRDGRSDYLSNKISGGLSSMKTETRIHLNTGGFRKTADQTIKRTGFSALVQLVDANGDGFPEIIEPNADVGLFTLARAMISKKISVDWLITPNKGGKLDSENPQKLSVVFGLDFSGGPMFRGPFPRFDVDYDGDGLPDFVSSPDGNTVNFHLGKREGYFEADPALKIATEASPYTSSFYDRKAKKAHLVTFFRDQPGKEGRVVILWQK